MQYKITCIAWNLATFYLKNLTDLTNMLKLFLNLTPLYNINFSYLSLIFNLSGVLYTVVESSKFK
jgi:hypothetical protein